MPYVTTRRSARPNLPATYIYRCKYAAVDCVLCGEPVDLDNPDVLSLVARWDTGSDPAIEDAIHRDCLRRAAANEHSSHN
jgi:hypothetical protein